MLSEGSRVGDDCGQQLSSWKCFHMDGFANSSTDRAIVIVRTSSRLCLSARCLPERSPVLWTKSSELGQPLPRSGKIVHSQNDGTHSSN